MVKNSFNCTSYSLSLITTFLLFKRALGKLFENKLQGSFGVSLNKMVTWNSHVMPNAFIYEWHPSSRNVCHMSENIVP